MIPPAPRLWPALLAASLSLPWSTASHADAAVTDGSELVAAAESAVRARASGNGMPAASLFIEAGAPDPRLRLAACGHPLVGFLSGDGQLRHQITVGVRCEGPTRWTIYMSVLLDSQARVLVARRALMRDSEVQPGDFTSTTQRVPGVASDYVPELTELHGQRLRQPLRAGDTLAQQALGPAVLIHRGQQIQLLAQAGGIEVRMTGVALSDGHAADRIKVENLSSQRVVEGIVRSDRVVETPL